MTRNKEINNRVNINTHRTGWSRLTRWKRGGRPWPRFELSSGATCGETKRKDIYFLFDISSHFTAIGYLAHVSRARKMRVYFKYLVRHYFQIHERCHVSDLVTSKPRRRSGQHVGQRHRPIRSYIDFFSSFPSRELFLYSWIILYFLNLPILEICWKTTVLVLETILHPSVNICTNTEDYLILEEEYILQKYTSRRNIKVNFRN